MKNSDDSGYTGKHVGVCVLDTGIFPHIDFTGRILAFQDFIGHRIRPYDDNSHGTHVCGIIGGDGRASEVSLFRNADLRLSPSGSDPPHIPRHSLLQGCG